MALVVYTSSKLATLCLPIDVNRLFVKKSSQAQNPVDAAENGHTQSNYKISIITKFYNLSLQISIKYENQESTRINKYS